jgi:hypothetical protein
MSGVESDAALVRAVELSKQVLAAADQGDLRRLAQLDLERLQLLQSLRLGTQQVQAADRELLQEISQLNDRALGLVEHQRRIKGRALDLAAVGRRAVAAYATNRRERQAEDFF